MSGNINDNQKEHFQAILQYLDNINWSVQQHGPYPPEIQEPLQRFQESFQHIQNSLHTVQQSFEDIHQEFQQLYGSIWKLQQCFTEIQRLPCIQQLEKHLQQIQEYQKYVAQQIGRMNEEQRHRDEQGEGEYQKPNTGDIEMSDI